MLPNTSYNLGYDTNMGTLDTTCIVDGGRQLGIRNTKHSSLASLGHICLKKQLQIIVNNTLAHRVNVSKGIASCLEREESNQIDNLRKLRNIGYTFFNLG